MTCFSFLFLCNKPPPNMLLKQKPLFAIFHASVAWLGSVWWFICSVGYHLGSCHHLKAWLGWKAQTDHAHGWQLVLTVTEAHLCSWPTASVLLLGSLPVMWASPSMAARFWEAALQTPESRNSRSLKVMSQKWHTTTFSTFCGGSGKIFGANSYPPWCVFHSPHTHGSIHLPMYLPIYVYPQIHRPM